MNTTIEISEGPLHRAPDTADNGIRISGEDFQMFSKLQSKVTIIVATLKEFTKRSRAAPISDAILEDE
jgi:hypothetical protein